MNALFANPDAAAATTNMESAPRRDKPYAGNRLNGIGCLRRGGEEYRFHGIAIMMAAHWL
ncbi:MAG: hypothetical protein IJP66_07480 [Kiritimatiellae bacterium]|nr:hypothetical protein [Kiritimatiellia bacterium]